ncbi:MAG: glycosyltransferase [Candidatus Eisenbacteria bacterium]
MARIVLTTLGSLGDLHPYLALGLELRARGHAVVIATHAGYRSRAESAGLEFAPVRPDYDTFGDLRAVMREAMDERRGSEVVLNKFVLPFLRGTHADLLAAARGADLMVDHVLTFTAPLVCEQLGLPRVSTTLQPVAMFSTYDPPLSPAAPWLSPLRSAGPKVWRLLWWLASRASRPWFRELYALRRELGLPPLQGHPMFDTASHELHLVLFSRELMPPQPDWPAAAVQTGFPIHDRGDQGEGMPVPLLRWLDAGTPPLVFTLGSSAVFTAGTFYDCAVAAAQS